MLMMLVKGVFIMQTLICPHWAPSHVGQDDDRFMLNLRPKVVKIFTQGDSFPRLDIALSAATDLVILRHHQISENFDQRGISSMTHAETMARSHAEYWKKLLAPLPSKNKIAVEGLNEPEVWDWGREKPELVSHYYAELCRLMAVQGVRTVVGNMGVGWPGNGEPTTPPASPPIWKPFQEMIETAMQLNGFLGVHEYWFTNGPKDPWITVNEKGEQVKYGGWGWWAGRFRTCPWNVKMIVTECGIDAHVLQGKDYFGWHGLPDPRAKTYIGQLIDYEYQCILDGRVVAFTPFTEDYYDRKWATYDTRTDEFHGLWLIHAREMERGEYTLPKAWALPKWSSTPWKPSNPYIPPETPPAPVPTPTPPLPPSTDGKWDTTIAKWDTIVKKYATACGLDRKVVHTLILLESSGDPNAINKDSGATGLLQVMPQEAGFTDRPTQLELLPPDFNVKWGCQILKDYIARLPSLEAALCAYGGVKDPTNLQGDKAQSYLKTFAEYWAVAWPKDKLPITIPLPYQVDKKRLIDARWWGEETVRKIKEGKYDEAVKLLLDNVIAPLYDMSGEVNPN